MILTLTSTLVLKYGIAWASLQIISMFSRLSLEDMAQALKDKRYIHCHILLSKGVNRTQSKDINKSRELRTFPFPTYLLCKPFLQDCELMHTTSLPLRRCDPVVFVV
ncbi:hypothetical protein GALMADRAFT_1109505 [Galerina marginata CBS 339.88]|uniref:Uncharacterized protein n=1 Tax=Galerina marginata (strain CBS 339.88) TaxID=685588 RepID=A0A067TLN5_GALM3|nr:hypothetical protein GALMADRAFT_1109505 [Galerina marginata CBS 339.88]